MNKSAQKRDIILASTSPRRKELLEKIGLKFKIIPSDYEEDMTLKMKSKDLCLHLALGKGQAVADNLKKPGPIIISADTLISYKDKSMSKPSSKADALRMLQMLRGKTHSVITAYALIDTQKDKVITRAVESRVTFEKLTNCQLKAYIATGEPMDKAAAYGIQGLGSIMVKNIDGDYYAIMGLPLSPLAKDLRELGVKVL